MRRPFFVPFLLAAILLAVMSLSGDCAVPVLAVRQQSVDSPLLPPPPQQGTPWTSPTGKDAEPFPASLLTATATLYEQGLADPRGCEYWTLSVETGNVWTGKAETVETHGWVLPGDAGGPRFAICWNGLVYPVTSVKDRANLHEDMRRLIKVQSDQLAKNNSPYSSPYGTDAPPEADSLSVTSPSPFKVAVLLRLGENDLAHSLWEVAAPQPWLASREIRRDPYLYLATQWAWSAYDRAVCGHMRGADRLALADSDMLTHIQPLIEAEAARRGYKTFPDNAIQEGPKPYLPFLANLPALRRESQRLVAESSLPPLDKNALKALPQQERIAELIRHMDEIGARQTGQPGGVGLDDSPISELIIAEGDAAVEPLLDVMEKDDRLTRSVSFGRDFFRQRDLLTVKSAALACFTRVIDVTEIGKGSNGKYSVAALREWWEKHKGLSTAERWFTQLADSDTTATETSPVSGRTRWLEAASHIVERTDVQRRGGWVSVPDPEPGKPQPPFKGESLRSHQNPSVSDLLREHALQLAILSQSQYGFNGESGATLALMLYEWDPNGPDTLSTLQTVMQRCIDFQSKQSRGDGNFDQSQTGGRIARLTVARLHLGDTAAAVEYGTWLRTVSPKYLGFGTRGSLLALWQESENPAILRVADTLFTEADGSATDTAWSRLMADPKSRDTFFATDDLFPSDLLRLTAFRGLVIRRLGDTTAAGVVTQSGDNEQTRRLAWSDGVSQGPTPPRNVRLRRQSLRICDRAALALQRIAGIPRFDPMASLAERDKQCAAITAYLNHYGTEFGRVKRYSSPLYEYDDGSIFDYLGPIFPAAPRPATETDVRDNHAIFALRGKQIRFVSDLPASFPIEAQWKKDPNPNIAYQSDGKSEAKRVFVSRGYIWQAEEVFNGREWVRYYGYVGPHSIARVPASEILITDYRRTNAGVAAK